MKELIALFATVFTPLIYGAAVFLSYINKGEQ
jgi:hypothetical protein